MKKQEIKTNYLEPKVEVVEVKACRVICASVCGENTMENKMKYAEGTINW